MDFSSFVNSLQYYDYGDEDRSPQQITPVTMHDILSTFALTTVTANALRFGYGALGNIGIRGPVSALANRDKDAFRVRTLLATRGIVGKATGFSFVTDLIETLDPVRRREKRALLKASLIEASSSPQKFASFLKNLAFKDPYDRGKLTERVYDQLLGTQAMFEKFKEKHTFGFIAKRTILPSDYHNTLKNILPDDVYRKHYRKLDTLLKKNLDYMSSKSGRKELKELIREVTKKGKGEKTLFGLSPEEIMSTRPFASNSLMQRLPESFRPPRFIMRVRGAVGDAYLRLPWKLRVATGGGWKIREANAMYTALLRTLEEVTGTERAAIVKGSHEVMRDYVMRYVNRVGYGRFMKVSAAAYLVPSLATSAAGFLAKKALSVPARLARAAERVLRPEFGREILMNSRMATERQRAVSAIQDAQLNARYLLGNEASLYH